MESDSGGSEGSLTGEEEEDEEEEEEDDAEDRVGLQRNDNSWWSLSIGDGEGGGGKHNDSANALVVGDGTGGDGVAEVKKKSSIITVARSSVIRAEQAAQSISTGRKSSKL